MFSMQVSITNMNFALYERNDMKRYIVDQLGFVLVEASRRFVVEVPDHISEEQAQELVENDSVPLPDDDGMEWWDTPDRKCLGYDVEIEETDVYDPQTVLGGPSVEGLRVIQFVDERPEGEAPPQ